MTHRIDETIEMKDLPTWLQELWEQNPSLARRAEKHYLELTEQCNIANVVGRSEQLPTLIEIDFDGHLKCQLETTDIKPKILKAVNGYGHPVDCREGKIRINEV